MIPYLAFNKDMAQRFKAVTRLEEKVFIKLVQSLSAELDGFTARAYVHEFAANNVDDAAAADFATGIEAVLPLLLNEQYSALPADEVIRGVIQGLSRVESFSSWTVIEKKSLKTRLKKILTDANIKLRARAWALVLERPCLMSNVRILTDLRPVFGNKSSVALEAVTVIHTLVMGVEEGGSELKTLHIALDTKDLESLKDCISRAEQKEKVLNALASRAGVTSLQIK